MELKNIALQLQLRSDRVDEASLKRTFVQVGPLIPLLSSKNNQVLFGRRGTGKTHVLKYLKTTLESNNNIVIYIDMRTIGSTMSIYNDVNISIQQRSIRLIVDVLTTIHDELLQYLNQHSSDFENYIPLLSDVMGSISGSKEIIQEKGTNTVTEKDINGTIKGELRISKSPEIKMNAGAGGTQHITEEEKINSYTIDYLDYQKVTNALITLTAKIEPQIIWIMIDEYAEVPSELQICLADMIHRVFSPVPNIIVKIAAIEHRSKFVERKQNGQYIGIELSADFSTCDLDNYMVFGNNQVESLNFFRNLLFNHINDLLNEKLQNTNQLIEELFSSETAFQEWVSSAEGVPRDAFNILSIAVQLNFYSKITVANIRMAAKKWYQQDKMNSVQSYPKAQNLLTWIITKVINQRHAKAFLCRSDISYSVLNYLYDARILHIIKTGISSQDTPGEKFNAYSIDYGCYCDLINTAREPKHLMEDETEEGEIVSIDVPKDDYRSIRRSILKMEEFEAHYEITAKESNNN